VDIESVLDNEDDAIPKHLYHTFSGPVSQGRDGENLVGILKHPTVKREQTGGADC
jgi:hypothetical protein